MDRRSPPAGDLRPVRGAARTASCDPPQPASGTRILSVFRPSPRLFGWVFWLCLAALAAWRYAGQAADDVYITYRYAYNLAAGRGLVFNPGECVFGVSDPGIAILLAALHRASGISIPDLGTAVTALALLVLSGTLLAAARDAGREVEGWLGGTLLLTSAYAWLTQGAGPLPALALLLLAAHQAGRCRAWLAGLLAGLAFCCRPDAALGAACLALLLAVEAWRRFASPGANPPDGAPPAAPRPRRRLAIVAPPLLFAIVFAAVAAAALLAAWRYFGSALPETLEVKRHFAALKPQDFVGRAFWVPAEKAFRALAGPGGLALLVLGIFGQPLLFRRGSLVLRLLVLHSLVAAAFYTAAEVPFFLWYTIPSAVALLYGASFVAGELGRRALPRTSSGAGRRAAGRAAALAAVLAALALASGILGGALWWAGGGSQDWRLFAYRRAGEWIRAHTAPDADVAFDEVGILGYYSDRPVRDLIGLVWRPARPYAAAGDPLGAFLAARPALLLFHTYDHRGGTRPIRDRPWFAAAYAQAALIPDPRTGADIRIYQRRLGASLPPPRPPWRRPPPPPS